jgi:hypothetical protein
MIYNSGALYDADLSYDHAGAVPAVDGGWFDAWYASSWFPAVWFAQADESEIQEDESRRQGGGHFIFRPAQPVLLPPRQIETDEALMICFGAL